MAKVTQDEKKKVDQGWVSNIQAFTKKSNIVMLFLGFSAGLPILLIFSSLSLWLREAGLEKSSVTYFSWAALGLSFKFVWAPLVDRLPLPFLNFMGRRRSWLLLAQVFVVFSILGMGFTDPLVGDGALTQMAIFSVLLGFSIATQDIVIDAYRIESDSEDMQAILSATYIGGYRIGMIVSGAGALFLASYFGSMKNSYSYEAWKLTYIIMAGCMAVGILTCIFMPEPDLKQSNSDESYTTTDYARFFLLFLFMVVAFVASFSWISSSLSSGSLMAFKSGAHEVFGKILGGFFIESFKLIGSVVGAIGTSILLLKIHLVKFQMVEVTYINPIKDFFQRYGVGLAWLLLALVGFYRVSDIVLGVISNVFYQDLGFSKNQIAAIVKTFGLVMALIGGFLGGLMTVRFGVYKILLWGAILSAGTNILFMFLAQMGDNLPMLYLVISADNLAAGLASAAFVAFLSSLTNISFTAVQYAIFSSLMTLFPKLIGGYSGGIVESVGYETFFLITALMGVPVLILVLLAGKKLHIDPVSK